MLVLVLYLCYSRCQQSRRKALLAAPVQAASVRVNFTAAPEQAAAVMATLATPTDAAPDGQSGRPSLNTELDVSEMSRPSRVPAPPVHPAASALSPSRIHGGQSPGRDHAARTDHV